MFTQLTNFNAIYLFPKTTNFRLFQTENVLKTMKLGESLPDV